MNDDNHINPELESAYHEYDAARSDNGVEPHAYRYEPAEPDTRRGVGLIAGIVALAVLFSALAGAIWLTLNSYVNVPSVPTETGIAVHADEATLQKELLAADLDAQDKHFSLEEAAVLPSTGDKQALSIRAIAAAVKPAVVAISTDISVQNYMGEYMTQAAGSGFIISADGYVVTNAHVVENAVRIKVYLDDGRTFDAAIVGSDRQSDVAVLKIDADNLTTVVLGDSDSLEVGELAVAIGNPTGRLSGTVTAGIISALDRRMDDFSLPLIQTDATINRGNSGGALINSFGEVIGINTLKISSMSSGLSMNMFEGLNFAIPINEAKPMIEALIRDGRVPRATIGIEIRTITPDVAEMNPELKPGVVVRSVQPGSAADEAGMLAGDVIKRFNNQAIENDAQLREARDRAALGTTVEVTVLRGEREVVLQLELREE